MWTTEDEIDYIKRIGNHTESEELRTTSRKIQLLKNYIQAAELRSRWGGIDKIRVIGAARRHLASLEAQIGQ
jgi:hypothetical protein